MATIHHLGEIPTTPNSPATISERLTHSPSPALSLTDWSEIDMMSSLESLPRENLRLNPYTSSHLASSVELRPDTLTESDTSRGSLYQSDSHHGFVMPSLPRITQDGDQPVVGFLKIAVSGAKGTPLLTSMASDMQCTSRNIRDDGVEVHTCSSSSYEKGNITMLDANFVPQEISKWLEVQLQRDAPIDLVIYALSSDGPLKEDLEAMMEIQKLAELVVVMATNGDEPNKATETESLLVENCVNNFRKRIWLINTEFQRNWDMSASQVESPSYRSFIPASDNSELKPLISAFCSGSGRIRAHAAMLQSRWFQSQLVVTLTEPVGALAQRVNLRRKAFESIGNLDPLGIARFSSIPRILAAIGTGIITGTLAALGVSALTSHLLLRSSQIPPACKRHTLFDFENLHH